MTIKEVKKGQFITLKKLENPEEYQVWIKGEYDRTSKTYSITNYSDINREKFLKSNKEVFVDFTF